MQIQRVFVTGGTGYLGSRVVRKLMERGMEISCAYRPTSSRKRLSDMADCIRWIPAQQSAEALRDSPFDAVVSLACRYERGGVPDGDVIEANTVFPLRTLYAAQSAGIRRFVVAGTGLPENMNLYSFSKSVLEQYGRFFAQKRGMDFFVAKLEMFYGPDEPSGRFLSDVIRAMRAGETVETTLGTQRRDLIYVDDAANAVVRILESDWRGYQEIPVGTGISPSISEVLDYILASTGKRSILRKGALPIRPGEPDCVADTSRLRELGSWNPIGWREGISSLLSNYSAPKDS